MIRGVVGARLSGVRKVWRRSGFGFDAVLRARRAAWCGGRDGVNDGRGAGRAECRGRGGRGGTRSLHWCCCCGGGRDCLRMEVVVNIRHLGTSGCGACGRVVDLETTCLGTAPEDARDDLVWESFDNAKVVELAKLNERVSVSGRLFLLINRRCDFQCKRNDRTKWNQDSRRSRWWAWRSYDALHMFPNDVNGTVVLKIAQPDQLRHGIFYRVNEQRKTGRTSTSVHGLPPW